MQLVAYGAQDIYLTGNPQITFFKVVYRRHTNFSMESIQQTWAGTFSQSTGAGRCTATIARNGDLVNRLYIEFEKTVFDKHPNASGIFSNDDLNNGPAQWINTVECEIGGQTIDRQTGAWMEAWAELTEPDTVMASINDASRFQRMSAMGGIKNTLLHQKGNIYVPLRFWFCENPGLALPLIALQYHEVKIIVDAQQPYPLNLSPQEAAKTNGDPQLWADYIYLDTDERRRFAQVSHEYLITQIQYQDFSVTGSANNQTCTLTFNHPVKELVWTGTFGPNTHQSYNGLFTSLSSGTYQLKLNGHDRFAARELEYFTRQQVWQYHSGPGGVNFRLVPDEPDADETAKPNDSIAVYSFALKPEEHQPSGTCNFSRIDNSQLLLNAPGGMTNAIRTVYAVNYNVLRIMSGMGGLAYSN
mgnify:CR=1 FL=1